MGSKRGHSRAEWTRRYPPLSAAVGCLLLAAFVLPSSLNVPQSNPQTTLEFAPVPPQDDQAPPATGNTASLSLGTSAAPPGAAPGGPAGAPSEAPPQEVATPPADIPAGSGTRPSTKRCVGNPPRQTEDPLSPPCVAFFEGDNFGATYAGVRGDEIRVLVYLDRGWINVTARGAEAQEPYSQTFVESRPEGEVVDFWDPPEGEEAVDARGLRALQRYFNSRYQTYGRRLHLYAYYAPHNEQDKTRNGTPESRRADAAATAAQIEPFGLLTHTSAPNEDVYLLEMARRGILVFGSSRPRTQEFFAQFPGRIWGYRPSVEVAARHFSTFVCDKVVGKTVAFSGEQADQGKPRKLGLLTLDNAGLSTLTRYGELVKSGVQSCGGEFAVHRTFEQHGAVTDARYTGSTYGFENMNAFMQEGVTTIIWGGGFDAEHTKAAGQLDYQPEWVVAGDGAHDGYAPSTYQNQDVWEHALLVTNQVLAPTVLETQCAAVYREADPSMHAQDISHLCTFRNFYTDLRQLMTGVQVAGPRLTPETMDRGFHAIPAVRSDDPAVPACYYEPGDYTCVKDAAFGWWDPDAPNNFGTGSSSANGCWRMALGGRRFVAGAWPRGDAAAQNRAGDPCNGYSGTFLLYRG